MTTFSLLTSSERNELYYGDTAVSAPERTRLYAGPLSLIYENGDLRSICYGETEIIRRIYMTVRGDDWSTPVPVLTEVEREIGADRFRIVYEARATLEGKGIDFNSRHTLTGTAEGNITYAFDGEALTDFKRNRLGICVLHPPMFAGTPCTVTHTEGEEENGSFPTTINPHQPFFDVARVTQEIAPGITTHIAFTGEVFEMEDQRNWLDASFKTYSTPQDRPKPVEQPVGSHVAQSVTLTISGAKPVETPPAGPVTVAIGADTPYRYPGVGLILPADDLKPDDAAADAIAGIRIEHLRVDVDAAGDIAATLAEAGRQAKRLDIDTLLIAIKNADKLTETPSLDSDLVGAYLVLDPTPEALAKAHDLLPQGVVVGAAFSGEFVNLNRNRPANGTVDVLAFPDAPQVHATDITSIMETPPTLLAQLATLADFAPGVPAYAGPLTFYRPKRGPDKRQTGLIGASWYAGIIAYAAQGGAERITLCKVAGGEGVVDADGKAQGFYFLLGALGVATGGQTQEVTVGDPLKVACLAINSDEGGYQDVFVVNLTRDGQAVRISGLHGSQARVRTLDETSSPRFSEVTPYTVENGNLSLNLLPFAIAQVIAGKALG